jgi:hypothetical protein
MSLLERFPESEEQILSCIDRGLDRVGPNVKYLVYWHLQKIGHIKRGELPANPENFVSALRGLYRESSIAVERAIVQEINAAFDLKYSATQLVSAINEARKKAECLKLV